MRKLLLLLLLPFAAKAQEPVLTLDEFFSAVKTYHPVARQAALQRQVAAAEVLRARGGFDPEWRWNNERKELGGTLYYQSDHQRLVLPTWYGAELSAGIQGLSGNYTDPTETLGPSSYLGISVPLAKNFLLDARRAALQQARLMEQSSEVEQVSVRNALLAEGAGAYFRWWQQYNTLMLVQTARQKAEERLRFVRTAVVLGDRPVIDTVEARAQLQSLTVRASEAVTALEMARLDLSAYLWKEGAQPVELPEGIRPAGTVPRTLPLLADLLRQTERHPELRQYALKISSLQVDRRLKYQTLLPSVYLKYNQLTKTHNLGKTLSTPLMDENFRYGLSVSVPLRFSEGRGAYRAARLKIEQAELEALYKRQAVTIKLRQYHTQWQQLQEQVGAQESAVQLYERLQRAEETMLANGESSLFLVNSRELKTLEAREKLLALQAKSGAAYFAVLQAAGAVE